jgi:hypothetical protein
LFSRQVKVARILLVAFRSVRKLLHHSQSVVSVLRIHAFKFNNMLRLII